ncbi:hypothetical protein [Microvirga sp. CF3016]|uniref:hypothetical protein n=1 Tax=Microvirga sp. CF3016 TaxID=3110181 RepID=UPI002E7933AF|nr:hypothetical protein [Microvirga sp. CF3016]MEE1611806.1 hypothetical protein [Microvirga sp. CF3016]
MILKLVPSALLLSIGFIPLTQAHDIYSHLKDSWGNSCCNDEDCRPAPYRVTPAGVQMLIDGQWVEVPGYTIQYRALLGDSGRTGGGHWCGRSYQKVDNSVFHVTQCAVLPPNSAALPRPEFDTTGVPTGPDRPGQSVQPARF